MAEDLKTELRRAAMTELKANESLTELVPVDSIYRQATPPDPTWPFVKMGAPIGSPLKGSCLNGQTVRFAVHGFARQMVIDGLPVEEAEDHAGRIGDRIKNALDGKRVEISGGYASFRWIGDQLMQDGDADSFHSVTEFRARVVV